MTGKDEVQAITGVRGGNPVQSLAEERRSGRPTVRADESDRLAGSSRRLAKRQESNGCRETSRLAVRERL